MRGRGKARPPARRTPESWRGADVVRCFCLALCWLLCPGGVSALVLEEEASPLVPLAPRALLLDLARAGDAIVAVGAQGVIVRSTDEGRSWTQARVPVRELLTGVSFGDARAGWAVGHGGVVLKTNDGGLTWTRVPVPVEATTSFLDVRALDARHVIAVGAFETYLESHDGGHEWQLRAPLGEKDIFDRVHLNQLTEGASGVLYLAGEFGLLARSRDRGATWQELEAPYEGSFYGLHETSEDRRLLAHGLRGRVFTSDDEGRSWTRVPLEPEVLLMQAAEGPDGTLALGGLGGNLFFSADRGERFEPRRPPGLTGTAALLFTTDGHLLSAGETGVHRLPVNPPPGSARP
jgi:photosystem II stability/assembly factor-like uncharacterized protein